MTQVNMRAGMEYTADPVIAAGVWPEPSRNCPAEPEDILPEGSGEAPENGRFAVRNSSLWADDRGVGVVEMLLILVVLIALVIIFKTQLTSLVKTIFGTITKNANSVLK